MFAISSTPGIHQVNIGDLLSLERSTLSREVGRLVKKGLVEPRTVQGSRSPHLYLTEKGQKQMERIKVAWNDVQSGMEDYLGKETLGEFKRVENKLMKT